MTEPVDVFSNQFKVTAGPLGAAISFELGPPHPVAYSTVVPECVAVVRLTPEMLKLLAFIAARTVKEAEWGGGIVFPVPTLMLGQMGIGPEDWEHFWG